ncbi:hypothetical protein [Roseixanthobacter glucoisosaccharinicivorans]|uniref:hypothetical protein n=1 Tax=Roseixanthobacter glucoisosaccharinicivorans TaxID=3119923 RepID=UPI003729EF98
MQNLFASVLDTFGARAPSVPVPGDTRRRNGPSANYSPARAEPAASSTFKITAVCAADMVEIEDVHAVRQRIVLSYGAREMLDLAMKRERRDTLVGLRITREAFEVEGLAFSRWAIVD